jgi:hypothetical protein
MSFVRIACLHGSCQTIQNNALFMFPFWAWAYRLCHSAKTKRNKAPWSESLFRGSPGLRPFPCFRIHHHHLHSFSFNEFDMFLPILAFLIAFASITSIGESIRDVLHCSSLAYVSQVAQSSPAVVCVAGQCLQGLSNTSRRPLTFSDHQQCS